MEGACQQFHNVCVHCAAWSAIREVFVLKLTKNTLYVTASDPANERNYALPTHQQLFNCSFWSLSFGKPQRRTSWTSVKC